MMEISQRLDDLLTQLDLPRATLLEALVRDAIALARETAQSGQSGWPIGYFKETAGAFADDRFERPPQSEGRDNHP